MNKTGRKAQLDYDRCNAFQAQDKLDEAIDCCRIALAYKADFADAHTNLGTTLHRQGKLNEASRDFYVTSECREPAVHVQEHRQTLAQLSEVLGRLGLRFIGFLLEPHVLHAYRTRFSADRSLTDLDSWSAFETEFPETFAGMYRFWVQKPAGQSPAITV